MSAARIGRALAACCSIALAFWVYWTLYPNLTAGNVGNDAVFLADGARHIAAGYRPHIDFSIPTGLLPFLNYFWAVYAFPHFSPYMGVHLIGFLWLVPLLAIAMAQLPQRHLAIALLLLVATAALLPFNITRNEPYGIAFFASYNRLGTALIMVWLAWLFRADHQPVWLKAACIAYALLLAFFLKIVLVGVVLAPVAILAIASKSWRSSALIGLAIASAALLLLSLSGGWVEAYLADIRSMSRINAGSAPYFLVSFVVKTMLPHIVVAALLTWLLLERWRERVRERVVVCIAQPLAMMAAVGSLSFAESQATGGLEFSGVIGLLFAPGLVGQPANMQRRAVLVAAISLTVGPLAAGMAQNIVAASFKQSAPSVAVPWVSRYLPHTVISEPMLRKAEVTAALWQRGGETQAALEMAGPVIINRSTPDLYLAQWASVDAALAQITGEQRKAWGTVVTLGNVDLFGLALNAKPVKGMKVVHEVGRTILPLNSEQARAYLSGADTVFRPGCLINEAPGNALMSSWFAQTLKADYIEQVLTPCWTMYRRKP